MAERAPTPAVDGRTARRDRNVAAVLDAVHDLFAEHGDVPSTEAVSARSGVSLRSVYRYFPDSRDMLLAALARRMERAEPLYRLEDLGEGPLDERVGALVDQRLTLYDEAAATIRAALAVAGRMPLVEEAVASRRRLLDEQAERQLAPELTRMGPAAAEDVLGCVRLLTQFDSVDVERRLLGRDRDAVRRTIVHGITAAVEAALRAGG